MEADRRVVLGMLGELELWLDDRPQPVGHARQRSVLAVLAVEANRVVPVDSLIDRVWGDRPPGTARSALRVYLTHLRRALAPTGITITRKGSGYTLAVDTETVDLHRFHRLLELSRTAHEPRQAVSLVDDALALWRGEPLAELDTDWAQAVRERLRQERAAAETDRVDWVLACGRHRQVLPELTARAEAEPLDERVAGQLMLALYRAGRQADAMAHYQHIRQRLVNDLGADPGPELQRLHQRILTADPALTPMENGTMVTGGSPPSVVPRQLPAPPRCFTGRTDHLTALDAALDRRGTVVISAIGGAGGIGKTWLALAWAHRHLDLFPDGQLFVDLRGFSPDGTPTDPTVALRGFLDALGVLPDRIPFDPEARAALYRSLVAGRRMLIVLDNAATAEQVTPLLPGGTTCTVLVTSRHRLPGLIARHGARPLPLGVLTETESRALFVATLGPDRVAAEESATAELIALCGGFPLALGLIAARVQPDLPLDEAVTELRESGLGALDADDPTASLPAVLSWSLRHLTDQQRTVFALLGIAPGPDTGLSAAASLAGLSATRTRAALRALEDASLLNRDAQGRYAMHEMVRGYATATAARSLTEAARRAALDRVVDFYLHTAHLADRVLDPDRQPILFNPPTTGAQPLVDVPAAMAWLDAEHAAVLAAQRTAATLGRHEAVWQLAWTLYTFHYRRGHHHANLTSWQVAVESADRLPDPAPRTIARRLLGTAHAYLGRYEESAVHLHEALALAEQHHDLIEQANAHRQLAWMWERRGDDRQALEHARHALGIYRALGQPVGEVRALNQMGWYAVRLGDYDTARTHCLAALTANRRHYSAASEADILHSLGWIDHHTGEDERAVDHYRQALSRFRELGDKVGVAGTLDHLGDPYAALGRHDQAREVWREALKLYREQGRKADAARVQRQFDALAANRDSSTESAT